MTRGIHAPPQPPLTQEQQKILDAYVLEAFALDPLKDAGCVAADATLENLIPGRLITGNEVSASKQRQEIIRPVEAHILKPEPKRGESTMIRRSEEEKIKLSEFCAQYYQECTAVEIADKINEMIKSKQIIGCEPVNVGYVRYLLKNAPKAPKNRPGKAAGAKKGRPAAESTKAREVAPEMNPAGTKSFKGLLEQIDALRSFVVGLQIEQQERIKQLVIE